ncbi:TetR family transcriptional regulator [Kribbella sandramycini]|uniref:AcrR family transcriptional regulator n=1 Tax=Kribbella sandramycini TaxID=60450 RepID=A0A7Y4P0I8_9ACTN|nr:TetR family transcriptional regulator [Kribbella sandramycini]MBB6566634.1 AcrR family transcriptional regulator [Kribbella sandramycini]NOL42711.1 TetR family transcriptional regulator [Kribbella sandramycini]
MARNSTATRALLLKAATDEFAQHGIAGARVDRIAAAAGYNKNMLYVHFGSKDALFDIVFEAAVAEIVDAVPFTADDLPGYAGRLFDFHFSHPQLMRLARWHSLERGVANADLAAIAKANSAKSKALAAAQAAGAVRAELPPGLLITLVVSMATAWSEGTPEPVTTAGRAAVTARRKAVVQAVEQLTTSRS